MYPSDTLIVTIQKNDAIISGNAREKHRLFHRLFTYIALHSHNLNSTIRNAYQQRGRLTQTQWKKLFTDFKDSVLVTPIYDFLNQYDLPLEQKRDFLTAADIQMDNYAFLSLRNIYKQRGQQSNISLTKYDSLVIVQLMEDLYNRCVYGFQENPRYNRLRSPYYDMIYSFLVQENSEIIRTAIPQSTPKPFEYFNRMPQPMLLHRVKTMVEEQIIYQKSSANQELLSYLDENGFGKTVEALRAFQVRQNARRQQHNIDTLTNISSLTNLRERIGRDVVVSLWATYCAPCKMEFQYHDKVIAFLKKYGYEFVHVSIDEAACKELWYDNITSYRLAGYHVLANELLKQELQRTIYNDKSMVVPRTFILTSGGLVPFKNINFQKFVFKIEESSPLLSLEQYFQECSHKSL